jgi:hypothetical protein
MITAEAMDRIVRFNGDGLPVVSLYSPVGAGAGRRDVRARVSSKFTALGLDSCLWAGTVAAIQTVLVQEGRPLRAWSATNRDGWRCPERSARCAVNRHGTHPTSSMNWCRQ